MRIATDAVVVAVSGEKNFGIAAAVQLNHIGQVTQLTVSESDGCAPLLQLGTLSIDVPHADLEVSRRSHCPLWFDRPLNGQLQVFEAFSRYGERAVCESHTRNFEIRG